MVRRDRPHAGGLDRPRRAPILAVRASKGEPMTRLLTALGILLLAAPAGFSQTAGLPDKDVAAIRAQTADFAKGLNAADFASVAGLYAETATFMPPNQPLVSGRAAIEAWLKGFPPVKDFALQIVEVDGRGDIAFCRGTYSMTIAPPGAPAPVKDTGKYIEVRRRQKDGSWKIVADIFNSDLPEAK
jgi:ketosteroid isomerase-like protein